uniref:TB domain-containing protein n=1 Tax=Cyclopterus lumpus TaxID=8103 RepID=A0A8C3G3N0_CYCLU
MFGSDICKNGQCSNLFSTYTCYCRSGFYYDNIRLECVGKKWLLFFVLNFETEELGCPYNWSPMSHASDYDECGFGNACEDGECVNTAGSFNCFCSPPLVLDSTHQQTLEPGHDVHMDICWQHLEGDNICSQPLQGRRSTYTECCCLWGIAWSGQCAFCPRKDSGENHLPVFLFHDHESSSHGQWIPMLVGKCILYNIRHSKCSIALINTNKLAPVMTIGNQKIANTGCLKTARTSDGQSHQTHK